MAAKIETVILKAKELADARGERILHLNLDAERFVMLPAGPFSTLVFAGIYIHKTDHCDSRIIEALFELVGAPLRFGRVDGTVQVMGGGT